MDITTTCPGARGAGRARSQPPNVGARRGAAMLLATAAAVLGCGEKLNISKAESIIRDDLATRFAAQGLVVSAVTCPSEVRMKQGNGFACEASFEGGGKLPVKVAQTDDKGTIEWTVNQRILVIARVEQQIVEKARADGQEVAVNCGDRVRVVVPQARFQCMAQDGAGKLLVFDVVIQNENGDVRWEQVAR
jgi:hypothetical protein